MNEHAHPSGGSGASARTCPQCEAALHGEGWEGLCPKCLVRVSLEAGLESGAVGEPLRRYGDYELLVERARGGMGVVLQGQTTLSSDDKKDLDNLRAEAEEVLGKRKSNIQTVKSP